MKSAKRTIQTKIPLRRKFNFITIIPSKKFPKIWITSQGCPWALSIRPLKFREANRSTENSGNSGVKIECNGDFQEIGYAPLGCPFFGNSVNSRFAIQR